MLIGVVGFIGSGKGTVGDILSDYGFIGDSFARPLKDAVAIMFGWPRELLEGDTELSRRWREEPDAFWSESFKRSFSPRDALQLMGTEAGRQVFHQDVWVISLLNRARGKDVVITDVRFQNEIKYIQENGGIVIRVRRGDDPVWYKDMSLLNTESSRLEYMSKFNIHRSEWDWVGCDFDYLIDNDGNISDLRKKIENVLQQLK
jgi:hypothetical protein